MKYNLPAKNIHLEITETAYTEDSQQIIRTVNELKEKGFVIEMDDFGSGYSSLNMLSELPIDVLKLDMKFIQNDKGGRNSRNIMSFIISLARWLNLLVIAEGVETPEQVLALRKMDCIYVQGYYYARPMTKIDFQDLLLRSKLNAMKRREKETAKILESANSGEKKFEKIMLIVDDIELNRAILAEIFKDYYYIVEKEDGQAALEYLEYHADEVGIIMLDLIMPNMDGFQMLEELKNDPAMDQIPVIITSQAGENSEARALDMGAADFISKPYHPAVCIRRVENVMAHYRLRQMEDDGML